uniref:G_PROTEIN_RECEP_F1_2 domain-containing protein n=1 Tax=Steinernema glaseri TaxID=37863 RepID=A0A1I7XYP6_9BILA
MCHICARSHSICPLSSVTCPSVPDLRVWSTFFAVYGNYCRRTMLSSLVSIYNVAINFTMVYSMIIYAVTLTIIHRFTPRSNSNRFLVTIIFWDFLVHVLWLGFHPYPMMPLPCFRLDGFLAKHFFSETLGHFILCSSVLCAINQCVGLWVSFQFRYLLVAYGRRIVHIHRAYGYSYCVLVHALVTVAFVLLYKDLVLSVKDFDIQHNDVEHLFCLEPDDNFLQIFTFVVLMIFIIVTVIIMVVLSFRKVSETRRLIGAKTAKLQKMFLLNLLLLSGIPILFGGVPIVVCLYLMHNTQQEYTQLIIVICVLIMLNYGSIMCVISLVIFKAYRNAVLTTFRKYSDILSSRMATIRGHTEVYL